MVAWSNSHDINVQGKRTSVTQLRTRSSSTIGAWMTANLPFPGLVVGCDPISHASTIYKASDTPDRPNPSSLRRPGEIGRVQAHKRRRECGDEEKEQNPSPSRGRAVPGATLHEDEGSGPGEGVEPGRGRKLSRKAKVFNVKGGPVAKDQGSSFKS
ncbi:hypothetical protein PAXINDRAFT_99614 [Paxillus involutus ATCC 200175]|uniref:Uncharacterized protein n=1 Tax=Paxillus involutus ATCC 200175 TaxID=664439 RepID=A0A0C9SYI7_PAXIN|nr:hypothetical protein PAXINDRAFT_99614 [Paxillus involutus ATCC 200175]